MKRLMDDYLQHIKEKMFRMGLMVEVAIDKSTSSLFERDSQKAEDVVEGHQKIEDLDREIAHLGHELIALRQPTAGDLRLITMILKVSDDLERMGAQAVNIADRAVILNEHPPLKAYDDLPIMAEEAARMVRDALDAFMERDQDKAQRIFDNDNILDEINEKIYFDVQGILQMKPQESRSGINLIMVAHNLERIGDLATNIAEDVIYLIKGEDIRHRFTHI